MGVGGGVALVPSVQVLSSTCQTSGCLRRMLAILRIKATSNTVMAAISTHIIDW